MEKQVELPRKFNLKKRQQWSFCGEMARFCGSKLGYFAPFSTVC